MRLYPQQPTPLALRSFTKAEIRRALRAVNRGLDRSTWTPSPRTGTTLDADGSRTGTVARQVIRSPAKPVLHVQPATPENRRAAK